jgi:alpha/beta superfamily hydrolase
MANAARQDRAIRDLIRYPAPMTQAHPQTKSESLIVRGPVGDLETVIDAPEVGAVGEVAVVCHPHPLHGGTMTNKVAHMLAKSFNSAGIPAIRFNFRGVGKSAGTYAEGIGETDDALAIIEWARSRWVGASISLAGFSFGGAVAIRAAAATEPARLVTVAPVDRLPRCPWLVIQGDQDEVVDPSAVQAWIEHLPDPPELALIPGVGHYFHGTLNQLKQTVLDWLAR